MGSFRFLLSRRWVLFFVVVVLLAWLAYLLGEWQFHRLDERRDRNAVIERNEVAPPAAPDEVMPVGGDVAASDQWRRVEATGTYVPEDTVIVRYRTRDGMPGADVVVPLETAAGPSLLVDRGWVPTGNSGATPTEVPAPPTGEVTVVGWARTDATDSTTVTDQSTRAISSEEIGPALDREVYGGFVDLESEDPAPAAAPDPNGLPELSEGPHFFYGLQWWFFGLLAIFGLVYLAYDEWRGPRPGRRGVKGSRPAKAPEADDADRDGEGAREPIGTRPSS
ncbi:SURF1 family protein [Nocardioides sp. CFH 31398]|uniref:SURF1 family cytochrome oxidase biogenesis protein n=1 Tax=Nocardioides sp. CFH 31398 TaxID=2919579 RepID=UPI001F06802E|nr:SURF1 family protein [Nocardioides sp. CFH 31398]MCH1866771.1 SURF1 family protein [Nocardioides sp. CFH 31398]